MKPRVKTLPIPEPQKRWPGFRGMETKKYIDPLLVAIEKHMEDKDVTATQFGISAVSDPKLVFDLREGRELRRATTEKIVNYMREAA